MRRIILFLCLLFLSACGYRAETGVGSCLLPPEQRIALIRIENPSLNPELNFLFRSALYEEMTQAVSVIWTTKEEADTWAEIEIKSFDTGTSVKGLEDKSVRYAVVLEARLLLYNARDKSLFWTSGIVERKQSHQGGNEQTAATRHVVQSVCEEMTSRLFHDF